MKIQTSDLSGAQLDWAVAQCDGGKALTPYAHGFLTSNGYPFRPSTDWSHGGPIIEGERIDVFSVRNATNWCAQSDMRVFNGYGITPLIAAMRCFVASKLGNEVEIPEPLFCSEV